MVCAVPLGAMAQTPGITAKSIVLGQSAAFSGPAAQLGIQMSLGTKAYFDRVNAQGGVYGRKIELKTRDDKYEANLCVENTKKFIEEDKVFALVSYVGTPTTVPAMAIFTQAARPDGVVMISAYTSITQFVRLMKIAGSTTQFHNVSFVGSKALADTLKDEGYGVAISQVVPFPWSPSVQVVKEYGEVLTKAGIADFNFSSLEGYIVGKVMVEGLKRAGKDLTREKLVAALEGMNNVDLGEFVVNFSPTSHSGSKFVDLTMIGRGGKFLK